MLPVDDTEVKIKKFLITLLNIQKLLPDGGLLGFGLSHLYPISSSKDIKLDELGKSLKGTDATIKRACDSLSLETSVKVIYKGNEGISCLLDYITDIGEYEVDNDIALYLKEESTSGLLVLDLDRMSSKSFSKNFGDLNARPILWLKP